MLTDAPGTEAPDGSFVVPRMLAVKDCAKARLQDSRQSVRV
jgi:hypothetical protein